MSTEQQQISLPYNVSPLDWGKVPYKTLVARNAFISLVFLGVCTVIGRCLFVGRKTMAGLQVSEPTLSSGRLVYRTFSKMVEAYHVSLRMITAWLTEFPLQAAGVALVLYLVLFLFHRRQFFAARKRGVAEIAARMKSEDWDRLAQRYGFNHLRG